MGDLEAREYGERDIRKVEAIWKYLQQGFKHKVAYERAMEEINNTQLSLADIT